MPSDPVLLALHHAANARRNARRKLAVLGLFAIPAGLAVAWLTAPAIELALAVARGF